MFLHSGTQQYTTCLHSVRTNLATGSHVTFLPYCANEKRVCWGQEYIDIFAMPINHYKLCRGISSSNKVHIICPCFGVDNFGQFWSFCVLAYRTIIDCPVAMWTLSNQLRVCQKFSFCSCFNGDFWRAAKTGGRRCTPVTFARQPAQVFTRPCRRTQSVLTQRRNFRLERLTE